MIFNFEERPSDSPFVERVWRAYGERTGVFTSLAASHWEIVVTRYNGTSTLAIRGPETRATQLECSIEAEWFGIIFKLGSFMPHMFVSALVDGSVDLSEATGHAFWLGSAAWHYPDYENADTFVARLVRAGLLVRDPIVDAALQKPTTSPVPALDPTPFRARYRPDARLDPADRTRSLRDDPPATRGIDSRNHRSGLLC